MNSILHFYQKNISWNIEEIKKLNFKFIETYQKNPSYTEYFHKRYENVIGNDAYYLPNVMPDFVEDVLNLPIFEEYSMKLPGIHRMQPGMALPVHSDPFGNVSKLYDIKNIEEIDRYIIHLEDSKDGHYTQVGDEIWCNYKLGDYVWWKGSAKHAAFNMGIEDRYTLQITCKK